jgi:hypothetical protein
MKTEPRMTAPPLNRMTAPQPLNRTQVLDQAQSLITGDRENEYGAPQDNFANIAQRWSQTVGVTIKPWQVALMMADLKIARMATTGKRHQDSFVDIAGYSALASELS